MFKYLKKSSATSSENEPLLQPQSPPSSPEPSLPPTVKLKDGTEVKPIGTVQVGTVPALLISIDDEDSVKLSSSDYRFQLIGKFLQGNIPKYGVVEEFLKGLYLKGGFQLYKLNSSHILITLSNESDVSKLWSHAIWTVKNNFSMQVCKWSPDFDYVTESSLVRVRISISVSKGYINDKDALLMAASLVGKSVEVDTLSRSREKICVTVDLMEPRIKVIRLMRSNELIELKIYYEHLPKYCRNCRQFGHLLEECNPQTDYLTILPRQSHGGETKEEYNRGPN